MRRLFCLFFLIAVQLLFADDKLDTQDLKFISFWEGTNPQMTLHQLASYCAPIFWFSPDEPELRNKKGKDIQIPAAFPFQGDSQTPVVYYQVTEILSIGTSSEESVLIPNENKDETIIDLRNIAGFNIDYNHYYKYEVGLGKHNHDTEQAQFKVYVYKEKDENGIEHYYLYFLQAIGRAHALMWYDNIYHVDENNLSHELELPFHILVEEGKHASCTDMNGDGYYTPGYDVNVRMNDAWELRDVIRTGELFSAKFEAWMAKVRKPEHRVFPPLPEDSPHRKKYEINGVYAPDNAVYELRPMPTQLAALPDELLKHDMTSYYYEGWPKVKALTQANKFYSWWEAENFIQSVGISFRANGVVGISFAFPLLIIKNVEAPLVGGWLVNRIYFQDHKLRDFGYGILYTPSASRFLDPYFVVGLEVDKFYEEGKTELSSKTDFVLESGIKVRGNVKFSPLKFLSVLTDFWGVRLGIKSKGFWAIDNITYVFEIGAGVW
ncbi:hypothetical protein MNBD_IGNAVI01-1150 [hydrothermal vent metagenome]|uniref:Uncharacterized protein n=1 Tax=hydrothermal vent metagenome TaxID=652676 RepID=A0A3B1C4N8_9ZZZZ